MHNSAIQGVQRRLHHITRRMPSMVWSNSEEIQSGWVEINYANTAIKMAHKYAEDNKKEEVQLPEEFKQHAALFSDKEVSKFPPSRE